MTLLRRVSERKDNKGKNYEDVYLCWRKEGRFCFVLIKPQFVSEYGYLKSVAVYVPKGESLEKYVD